MRPTSAPTGAYADRIIDVHPRKDTTLPPISHFQAFFSRFGPILTVYHQDNSRNSKKPDHTFVVFKNESSVTSVKEFLARKDTSNHWKESYNIVSGIKAGPVALMKRIISGDVPGSSAESGQNISSKSRETSVKKEPNQTPKPKNLKRNRREESSGAEATPGPNKRKKTAFDEAEASSQDTSPPDASPSRSSIDAIPTQKSPPNLASIKRETFTPNRLAAHLDDEDGATSALELAQEAADLAAKSRRRPKSSTPGGEAEELRLELERMKAKRDKIKSERDQLRAERDEARVESEKYRAERDKAIEQREAEAERCRELKRDVERLKKLSREKDENSDKVLKLTIASLQSLRESGRSGSSSEA